LTVWKVRHTEARTMMLATAIANRNIAETNVPTTPPKLSNASKRS
jgi:hypothetical protein